jgi:hypothetical protein
VAPALALHETWALRIPAVAVTPWGAVGFTHAQVALPADPVQDSFEGQAAAVP